MACNIQAQTETPAIALFLDALEDKRLEGRLTPEQFTALALELDETVDCGTLLDLARDWDQSAISEAAAEACPHPPSALASEPPTPRSLRAQWTHAFHPRSPDRDGFALTSDLRYGELRMGGAFRDTALIRRYVEAGWQLASGHRLSLHAGNLQYTLPDVRIPLVWGRNAPAGLTYSQGPAFISSPHPGANGLGLCFTGETVAAATHASWNQATRAGERVDLLQYGAGARWYGEAYTLGAQNLLIRYESVDGRVADHFVGGVEGGERQERLRLGMGYAYSRVMGGEDGTGGAGGRLGYVAEAELTDKWSARRRNSLRVYQSTPGWENPLASASLRHQDTSEGGFPVPGAGEGGLTLQSRLPLGEEKEAWHLQADSELGWLWLRDDWLRQGFRLGLEKKWGLLAGLADWRWDQGRHEGRESSYWTLGSGARYGAETWRAALRYSHRGKGYGGLFPRSLQGDIAWRRKRSDAFRLGWQTGDVLKPLSRNRIYASQDFDIAPGLRLTGILKLPLAEAKVEESLNYRLQVRASY